MEVRSCKDEMARGCSGLFKSLRMVAGVGLDRKIMSLELKSLVDVGGCAGECLEVSR